MTNTTQEVAVIEEQITKMMDVTSSLVINNQEDYDRATEIGKKVSKLLKNIDDKEKAITKPINDSLKSIRDLFRPYKSQVETAKENIKKQMADYLRAEDEKRRIEEARIEARLEKGTIKETTAVAKIATLELNATDTSNTTTSVLKVKLVDITAIPPEFLLIDEAKIKQAYRAGVQVPGVECYYEKAIRL